VIWHFGVVTFLFFSIGTSANILVKPRTIRFVKSASMKMTSKGPIAEALSKYFACVPKLENLARSKPEQPNSCVGKLLQPNVESNRLRRFSAWLLQPLEIASIQECRAEEMDNAQTFPEATANYVCFTFKTDKSQTTAIAFFKKVGNKFYLYSFYY
jgi:hypothetical protein